MMGVVAGGVAFLVAGSFVPLLVRFAVGRNLLDVPNLRTSPEVPTPRRGGAATSPRSTPPAVGRRPGHPPWGRRHLPWDARRSGATSPGGSVAAARGGG